MTDNPKKDCLNHLTHLLSISNINCPSSLSLSLVLLLWHLNAKFFWSCFTPFSRWEIPFINLTHFSVHTDLFTRICWLCTFLNIVLVLVEVWFFDNFLPVVFDDSLVTIWGLYLGFSQFSCFLQPLKLCSKITKPEFY